MKHTENNKHWVIPKRPVAAALGYTGIGMLLFALIDAFFWLWVPSSASSVASEMGALGWGAWVVVGVSLLTFWYRLTGERAPWIALWGVRRLPWAQVRIRRVEGFASGFAIATVFWNLMDSSSAPRSLRR